MVEVKSKDELESELLWKVISDITKDDLNKLGLTEDLFPVYNESDYYDVVRHLLGLTGIGSTQEAKSKLETLSANGDTSVPFSFSLASLKYCVSMELDDVLTPYINRELPKKNNPTVEGVVSKAMNSLLFKYNVKPILWFDVNKFLDSYRFVISKTIFRYEEGVKYGTNGLLYDNGSFDTTEEDSVTGRDLILSEIYNETLEGYHKTRRIVEEIIETNYINNKEENSDGFHIKHVVSELLNRDIRIINYNFAYVSTIIEFVMNSSYFDRDKMIEDYSNSNSLFSYIHFSREFKRTEEATHENV